MTSAPAGFPTIDPLKSLLSRANDYQRDATKQGDRHNTKANNQPLTPADDTLEGSPSHGRDIPEGAAFIQGFSHIPTAVMSGEAVYREILGAATRTLLKTETPKSKKDKIKSRMRRAFLRKYVLKMLLGKDLTDWVYPWLHPKARPPMAQ